MNRSMPPSVVIPELPYRNVRDAVEWLCRVFRFVERLRIADIDPDTRGGVLLEDIG